MDNTRSVRFQGGGSNVNSVSSSNSPEAKLTKLKKMISEQKTYYNLMSQYERQVIGDEIKAKREDYYSDITNYYLGKFETAITRVKAGQEISGKARQNEINRWDQGKLNENITAFENHVARISKTGNDPMFGINAISKIERIFEEAQASGDMYKQRAICEVVKDLQIKGDIGQLGALHSAARNILGTLRQTEQIKEATQLLDDAVNDLTPICQEMKETATILGEPIDVVFSSGNYTQALRRVKIDPQTREVVILEKDDPEVLGWDKKNLTVDLPVFENK